MISIRDLTHAYHEVVIDHLNLDIREQDFLCILGPSGSGKSTLLKIIADLEPPTSGHLQGVPKNKGFVFQEPTLLPWRNARDNIALPKEISSRIDARIEVEISEALTQLGLKDHEHKYPHELSGGMKMRVSVARALISDPQLMLLDEPFSALDETIRFRLQEDFRKIWSKKKFTAILVTHSVQEAVFLANRILLLSATGGKVVQEWAVPDQARDHAFRRAPQTLALIENIYSRIIGGENEGVL